MTAHPRVPLAMGALSLLVAAGASVAALYQHEPEIGLRTGRAPGVQELHLDLEAGAEPDELDPGTTVPTPAPSTTAGASSRPTTTVDERAPVTITGTVRSSDGAPLRDVCVGVSMADVPLAHTDDDGRYRIVAPYTGQVLYSVFATPCAEMRMELGWMSAEQQTGRIGSGGSAQVDFALTELGGVYGQVVDTAGNPVAGVCVHTGPPTDAEGRFAVRNLGPGRQEIGLGTAVNPMCRRWAVGEQTAVVDVRSGEWSGPVTIVATSVVDS